MARPSATSFRRGLNQEYLGPLPQRRPLPAPGLPRSEGNRHVATLEKTSGIGAAPWGPQSNAHAQVPLVVITRSPRGKARYLVGTHGLGVFSHLTGSKPSLATVA